MFSERSITLMKYLERTGGATSLVASLDLGLDRGTVAGMIARLEKYQMIYRQPSEKNYGLVFSATWNWRDIVAQKEEAHKQRFKTVRIEQNARQRHAAQQRIKIQNEQMLHRAIKQNSVFSLGSL